MWKSKCHKLLRAYNLENVLLINFQGSLVIKVGDRREVNRIYLRCAALRDE